MRKIIDLPRFDIKINGLFAEILRKDKYFVAGIWLQNPINRMKFGWAFDLKRLEFSFGSLDIWFWWE